MRRLALAGVVAAGALAVGAGGGPKITPNLFANGSFERSTRGWAAINATLGLRRGGAAGRRSARVSVRRAGRSFSVYPVRLPVASTGKRVVYRASAQIRSDRPGRTVCLRIREWRGKRVVDSTQACRRAARGWSRLGPVVYEAAGGRGLDAYVYQPAARAGDRFDVDALLLNAGGVTPPPPPPTEAFMVAVGDIATCGRDPDEATAALVAALPGTLATLGDNVYESGSPREFAQCYDPAWGRFRSRTRPSVGNHEYGTPGAAGYFDYFGEAAGPRGKGWYSYDLGAWHVVALNSNCHEVGGCQQGSPQEQWLAADLAANPTRCTLAYMHHPRFSSGSEHGNSRAMTPIWQTLYARGADVVLSGHDHNYERFAPQTPAGELHLPRGIRQFVVGTGGRSLRTFGEIQPNSEARDSKTYGVLVLRLLAEGYEWRFVPIAGQSFTDSGSGSCH
ncbi:MAG: metallophosphoesterase [Gaiellaceae bacterium]